MDRIDNAKINGLGFKNELARMLLGLENPRILAAVAAIVILFIIGLLVARFRSERASYRDDLIRKRYSSDYTNRRSRL